jgi:hypothetical protein
MVDTEPLKITYNLSHCYLEVARGSMTTIHHQSGSLDKFLSGHAPEPLANAILSLVSITVIYSYLTIESFVNYQLFRLWKRRHDGSQEAKNFLQELGDPEKFEKLKNHNKVRDLGERLKTLCVLLGYQKPHEAIPETWQKFNDLVETSRHFFVHPHPEKEFFQNNLSRIGMQTKAGEYVKVAEEILSFLYARSRKQPPTWVNCNTLLEFKGVELL